MKKLLILSGKGGTGKTTTAAGFISFSKAEAFADCDVDAPNLHLAIKALGKAEETDFTCGQKAKVDPYSCLGCGECEKYCRFEGIKVEKGAARVDEINCEGCGVCEYICPGNAITLEEDIAGKLMLYEGENVFSSAELKMGRGNSGKLVSEVKFALFSRGKDKPLAMIDGSPGIGCPVIASISGVDIVLGVTEPTVSGISDLKRLWRTASGLGATLAVCVNKWDVSPGKTEEIEAFCRENNIPYTGKIPFDKVLAEAMTEGRDLEEVDCPGKDALYNVWCNTYSLLKQEVV